MDYILWILLYDSGMNISHSYYGINEFFLGSHGILVH